MPDVAPVMKMVLPLSFMMRLLCKWCDEGRSAGETVAEHRQAADGFSLGRLVLKHIPVLGEFAVFHADNVGGDPGRGPAVTGEAPMGDDVITFREDEVIFIFQPIRQSADQVEQAVAAGRDVGAMLDVAIGPETLSGGIIPLVEECVEGFEYERLVLGRGRI